MGMTTRIDTLTKEELIEAFEHTNYGEYPDYSDIVKWALLKVASGYRSGHTTTVALRRLSLINKSVSRPTLTIRGEYNLWEFFRDEYEGEMIMNTARLRAEALIAFYSSTNCSLIELTDHIERKLKEQDEITRHACAKECLKNADAPVEFMISKCHTSCINVKAV